MKTLTLDETIEWMNKCLFEGTDYGEDFWSNFHDALDYLTVYRKILEALNPKVRKNENAR